MRRVQGYNKWKNIKLHERLIGRREIIPFSTLESAISLYNNY